MKKILNFLKIISLYIKKAIKVLLKAFARSIYIIIAIGYIGALGVAFYAQDIVTAYNTKAIEYAKTASSSYQAYETVKNIDKLQSQIQDKLKTQYKVAEDNISKSIKNVNEKDLAKEMLFKGKKIEQTTFVKNIKDEIKNSFNVNLSKEFKNITASQKPNSTIAKVLELLESNKIVMMVLLLLTFPFLSPIVLACVILVIISKKYLKRVSNPNEANYISMVPSLYIMNMVLGIVSVVAFYFCSYAGLAIASAAHALFILKVVNGIRLKKMGECLSCGQKLPDELDTIKTLKAEMKKPVTKAKKVTKKTPAKNTKK
jgi:hypothetical protein